MPETSATQVVLLVMVVVVLGVLMLSTRRRLAQSRSSAQPTVRQRYKELQQGRNVAREVEQVLLELDQVARQVHGRLDTRLAKLETLIRDADTRIDRLSRLMREADGTPTIDLTLAEVAPTTSAAASDSDRGESSADERYSDIYRLADGGLCPQRIADETERTVGEVELILGLRRTKEQPSTLQPQAVKPAATSSE